MPRSSRWSLKCHLQCDDTRIQWLCLAHGKTSKFYLIIKTLHITFTWLLRCLPDILLKGKKKKTFKKGYSTGQKGHGNIKEIIFYITPNILHQFQIWIQSVCILSLCEQNFVAKQWHLTHFLIHLQYSYNLCQQDF